MRLCATVVGATLGLVAPGACGGKATSDSAHCPAGTQDCACLGDETCLDGLTCTAGRCVALDPYGGSAATNAAGGTAASGIGGSGASGTGGIAPNGTGNTATAAGSGVAGQPSYPVPFCDEFVGLYDCGWMSAEVPSSAVHCEILIPPDRQIDDPNTVTVWLDCERLPTVGESSDGSAWTFLFDPDLNVKAIELQGAACERVQQQEVDHLYVLFGCRSPFN